MVSTTFSCLQVRSWFLLMASIAVVGCSGSQVAGGSSGAATSVSATAAATTVGAAGLTNSTNRQIRKLDTSAAPILIATPGQNASVSGTLAISGTASGYLNVEVSFNGTVVGRTTPSTSGAFNVSVSTDSVPDGHQSLVLKAWNSPAGEPYTVTNRTTLDIVVGNGTATPPVVPIAYQIAIAAPGANSTVNGIVSVSGSALGFLNVEVSYNGALLGRTTPSISGAFVIPTDSSSLPKGPVTLVVKGWDSPAGQPFSHTNQASINVVVASVPAPTPPATVYKIAVASPQQNATVAGAIVLAGTAPGFLNVEVSFNGMLFGRAAPSASGAFSVSMSTMSLPDGPQTLVVNAWDSSPGQPYKHSAEIKWVLAVNNGSIKITDYGAVADGITDNITAINNAVAAAQSKGVSVFIPAGTFAYSNVISLTNGKMFGVGNTSILYALNWSNESIFMYGDGTEVRQLKLTGVTPPGRVAPWEATRITVFGATHFVIDHVTILDSAAAGMQTAGSPTGSGASNGKITNNTVMNTLSDSIHITSNASYITLENNHIENSGDDGIAVVSYLSDGGYVNNITAKNNVVLNNLWGRNMSVVGGQDIVYENNDLEDNVNWACLYLAQEGSYNTYGDVNVTAEFNTLKVCGNQANGHGAIMLITTGNGENTNVQLVRNDVIQTGSGNAGIRVFGSNQSIVLDSNLITGAVPPLDIESPAVTLTPYTSGPVGYTAVPPDPIP